MPTLRAETPARTFVRVSRRSGTPRSYAWAARRPALQGWMPGQRPCRDRTLAEGDRGGAGGVGYMLNSDNAPSRRPMSE